MKTIKEKQRELLQTYVNELKKYIKNYSRNGKGLSKVKILCLIKTLESLKVPPYAIGLRHKSEYYEHGDLIILQYKLPCGKTLYYSTTCDCSEDANNYFYTLEDGEISTATGFVQGGEVDAINELTKTLKGTCPEIPRIVYRWILELPGPFENIVASFAFENKNKRLKP